MGSLQPLAGAYDRTIYAYFVLVWGFSACKNVRDHQFILLAVGKFLRTKSMKKAMQTYMYLAVGNLSLSLKKQKKLVCVVKKKTRAAPLEEVQYYNFIFYTNWFFDCFSMSEKIIFLGIFPQNLEKLFLSKD